MQPGTFNITEHVVDAQHIREYPSATADNQEDILSLHVRQYTPIDKSKSTPNAVTIIGAHANGFPKELYEPLWQEICERAGLYRFSIRSIWIADVAHQGKSGVLNEEKLGNDPSWLDHSRDLLYMINYFRKDMPRPIIGIGHSFGAAQLVNLSYMHARLFTALILLDPVIELGSTTEADQKEDAGTRNDIAYASTYRRDLWPSREDAARAFARNPFYQRWDGRVFDRWVNHGLRDLPTAIYPEKSDAANLPVTLMTSKHQEVWTFLRPNYQGNGILGSNNQNRLTHPDVDPSSSTIYPFYRPESAAIYHRLPTLRPSVLYIMGELSNVSPPERRRDKVKLTGTGPGGSGGLAEGQVVDIILPGVGHLVPMEAVDRTADEISKWLSQVLEIWRKNEEASKASRSDTSSRRNKMVNDEWMKHIGEPPKGKDAGRKQKL